MTPANSLLRECQDCGLFQEIGPLAPGEAADCARCNATLRRGRPPGFAAALVCTLAALFLFLVALKLPFLGLRSIGRLYQANIFTGPSRLEHDGMGEVSALVLFTLVGVPVVLMGLVTTVLGGLYLKNPPKFLPRIFGWVERLRPWSMIEVFLLGSFVAYSRLQVIAEVDVGPALIAFGGVMLCMVAADVELDHEAVWEALEARGLMQAIEPDLSHPLIGCDCCRLVTNLPPGRRCPRCHRKLWRRKPRSLAQTYAFLVAATSLYLPANIYPVMTVLRFAQGAPSTILGGVAELIENSMYPLALLVFLASILVPVLKLAALATMLITTQLGSVAQLRQRTRLYRFIEFIGRWSMIDVFMITILVALVRLGYVATVLPGIGAIAFASVVVLTMLASASFDPRLMWDAAIAAGHDVEGEWVRPHDAKTA